MKYTDEERVRKILEYAYKLNFYIVENKISKENLLKDEYLQWFVTTPLYNIGEQAYYLSDDFKERYNYIPWAMMSGLRHRLVHDYDGTNWNIIVEVVFEEIPELVKALGKIE